MFYSHCPLCMHFLEDYAEITAKLFVFITEKFMREGKPVIFIEDNAFLMFLEKQGYVVTFELDHPQYVSAMPRGLIDISCPEDKTKMFWVCPRSNLH